MQKRYKFMIHIGGRPLVLHFTFLEFIMGILSNIMHGKKFHVGALHTAVVWVKYHAKRACTVHNILAWCFIIVCTVEYAFLFDFSFVSGFFLFFAVMMYVMRWDARIAIMGGLICLVAVMVLLVLYGWDIGEESWSETVAVWAYFFLVIGVVGQMIELVVEKRSTRK